MNALCLVSCARSFSPQTTRDPTFYSNYVRRARVKLILLIYITEVWSDLFDFNIRSFKTLIHDMYFLMFL
jgi:hypothetical protein